MSKSAKPRQSKREYDAMLAKIRRRVVIWTAIVAIVVYSIIFFFAFSNSVHSATDSSQYKTQSECEANNGIWNSSNGKDYVCSNHGCQTDTFFDWGCGKDNGEKVTPLLLTVLNWLAVGVAVVVVGGIIYGGITYSTAAGDQGRTQEAIKIIRSAVIALIMYFAMWALLNWLVPGGMFN